MQVSVLPNGMVPVAAASCVGLAHQVTVPTAVAWAQRSPSSAMPSPAAQEPYAGGASTAAERFPFPLRPVQRQAPPPSLTHASMRVALWDSRQSWQESRQSLSPGRMAMAGDVTPAHNAAGPVMMPVRPCGVSPVQYQQNGLQRPAQARLLAQPSYRSTSRRFASPPTRASVTASVVQSHGQQQQAFLRGPSPPKQDQQQLHQSLQQGVVMRACRHSYPCQAASLSLQHAGEVQLVSVPATPAVQPPTSAAHTPRIRTRDIAAAGCVEGNVGERMRSQQRQQQQQKQQTMLPSPPQPQPQRRWSRTPPPAVPGFKIVQRTCKHTAHQQPPGQWLSRSQSADMQRVANSKSAPTSTAGSRNPSKVLVTRAVSRVSTPRVPRPCFGGLRLTNRSRETPRFSTETLQPVFSARQQDIPPHGSVQLAAGSCGRTTSKDRGVVVFKPSLSVQLPTPAQLARQISRENEMQKDVTEPGLRSADDAGGEDKNPAPPGSPATTAVPRESFLRLSDLTRQPSNDVADKEEDESRADDSAKPKKKPDWLIRLVEQAEALRVATLDYEPQGTASTPVSPRRRSSLLELGPGSFARTTSEGPRSMIDAPSTHALLEKSLLPCAESDLPVQALDVASLDYEQQGTASSPVSSRHRPSLLELGAGSFVRTTSEGSNSIIDAPSTHALLEMTSLPCTESDLPVFGRDGADSDEYDPDAKVRARPKRRRDRESAFTTRTINEPCWNATKEQDHEKAYAGEVRESVLEECPTVRRLDMPLPHIPPVPLPSPAILGSDSSPMSQHSAMLAESPSTDMGLDGCRHSGSEPSPQLQPRSDFEPGDIVALGAGAPPEYRGKDAIVTKVAATHCTVVALDGELRLGAGECWPSFQDTKFKSSLGRLGTRVIIQGLTGARTKRYNGRKGTIVAHHREGHPCFIRKPSIPDHPVLVLNVELDKDSEHKGGKPEQVMLEMRFLAYAGGDLTQDFCFEDCK